MKIKKILIPCAGIYQRSLIERARARGYEVNVHSYPASDPGMSPGINAEQKSKYKRLQVVKTKSFDI